MNNMLQAVITDLDGSLLGDDKEIGAEDLATIARLKEMGIPVFIATGRHQAICRCYARQIGTDYPTITSNGGLLYDFSKEEILGADYLLPQDVTALQEFAVEHGIYYFIYSDRQCFLNGGDPNEEFFKMDMALMELANEGEFEMMGENFAPNDYRVLKVMLPNCTPDLRERLLQLPCVREGRVEPSYSGNMFMDVNAAGASKGTAARELARRYGFSLEHTLAMGDNFNDEKMLAVVGYPVVPCTAAQEVQGFARLVTCPNGNNPLTHAVNSLFPRLLDR